MSKKNSDVFSEVIVGIFMVAVIALLGYFTIIISGVDVMFGRKRATATIAFKDVGGLKERDNVVYRGMKVGTVDRIILGQSNILVEASVDDDVVLRKSCRVSVSALSLLGGNYLLLEEGTGEPQPLTTTVFHGEPPVDWMRDLGTIARNLSDLTSDGNVRSIVTNFEATAANLNTIVSRVQRGEGTVGKLLSSDETVYNDISNAVASAKTAAADISAIASRVERGDGTLGKLLSTNDVIHADLRDALASARTALDAVKSAATNINAIAARLERGEGTMGKLLSSDDAVYADLKASLANIRKVTDDLKAGEGLAGRLVYDKKLGADASELLENLNGVSSRLAKGSGTLGKLMTDQELYNELNALIKDVRQIVDNYRDTTPVSTFGSLIMGGL
ncbi:MAG: MCE family protein [Kiritimatiellae bacterium]|nr:MCE family protein [Kiritimatiellia bacterium]